MLAYSNSNFTFILSVALSCGIVILLTALRYYYKQLTRKNTLLTRVWDILNTHSDAWYAWSKNEKFVNCSTNFPKLFNLPHTATPESINILEHFNQEDAQQVYVLLEQLINYSTPFSLEVKLANSEEHIKLRGEPLWPPSGDGFVLWAGKRGSEDQQSFAPSSSMVEEGKEQDTLMGLSRISNTFPESQVLLQRIQQFEALINNCNYAIWLRNPEGKLIFCNKYYGELLRTQPELATKQNLKLFPFNKFNQYLQSEPVLPLEAANSPANNEAHKPISYNRLINGKNCIFEIREYKIDHNRIIGYAIDVTELEKLKQMTENNHNLYQQLIQSVPIPMALFDNELRLQIYNLAYQKLYIFSSEFLEHKPHLNEIFEELRNKRLIPEHADFPAYKKSQIDTLLNLKQSIQEVQHLPDGRTLKVLWSPTENGNILMGSEDVSDKLNLERRYNTILEVNKQVLTNLWEGVAIFGSDHRLRFVNRAFARIWNLNNAQIAIETHLLNITESMQSYFDYSKNWEELKNHLFNCLDKRIPTSEQITRVDGSVIKFSYLPLPDGEHLLSYIDVTDSLYVEQAIRERNAALMSASRIKSDFIKNLAMQVHPIIENILQSVGELSLPNPVESSGESHAQLSKALSEYIISRQTVQDNTKRLFNIITELMHNVSFDTVNLFKTEFNLRSMIEDLISESSEYAEEQGVSLIMQNETSDASPMLLYSDDVLLRQSLGYLMKQAISHTHVGGNVTIILRQEDNDLIIKISDTGSGIPQETIDRTVNEKYDENYYEIRSSNKINLVTIKRIIELHGGEFEILSAPGMGTTISCRLPKYALIANIPAINEELQSKQSAGYL